MDVAQYIASGILELYVAGALSEEQNLEVYRYAQEYPEIRQEIEAIEKCILQLSSSAAVRTGKKTGFQDILKRIDVDDPAPVIQMRKRGSGVYGWVGWAAAIVLAAGLWWYYLQNENLRSQMQLRTNEIQVLEDQIFQARSDRDNAQYLLDALRDKDITLVALAGQEAAPQSYAKIYWNKTQEQVFVDAQGLPEPPDGMVYQVWSLKMTPLTPTSIGLLEDFTSDENKIFNLTNTNESEGFGITLEPAGGSETPTMEQLYTLGSIES